MNAKIYVLITLASCIGLLLTGFPAGAGQLETSVTLSVSGVIQQTPTETYTYIISVSGSNYQIKNGTTRQIVFQSTNSSQVFSNVVANCSDGSNIYVESGVYTVTTSWVINVNNVTLNFENGAKLVAGNSLGMPVLLVYANYCSVIGVTIDGNAENQVITGIYPTSPIGVLIAGSNDAVSYAQIYNVLDVGVAIYNGEQFSHNNGGYPTKSGVSNSKIYNCGSNGFSAASDSVQNSVNSYLIDSEIYGCSDVGATTYGIGTIIKGNYIHDLNGTTGTGGNVNWGIGIEGGSNAIITQNTIQNCSTGIYNNGFNNCTISNNLIIGGNRTTAQNGIRLHVGAEYNSVIYNSVIGMIYNLNKGNGIDLMGASFNLISGNTVSQCGYDGIFVDESSNSNAISLNIVSDNNFGRSRYSGNGGGIDIYGNNNYISQNQAFDDRPEVYVSQRYGIHMESGAYNNVLKDNNAYNNWEANIYDPNIPENTKINNIGYNPVGPIPSPISGSTAYLVDSGSNSTWISGKLYTNTGSPKVLNISGGTVVDVAQNGVTLFTMTGCTVTLQPGYTFSVTFSTAPTINVIGQ